MDSSRATTPFSITTSQINNGKGFWDYQLIEIFEKTAKIGEYKRNYSSHGAATFAPFKVGDQWYALFSKNYTQVHVMSLPDCTEICEVVDTDAKGCGFCPAEIYVPRYRLQKSSRIWNTKHERQEKEENGKKYVSYVPMPCEPYEEIDYVTWTEEEWNNKSELDDADREPELNEDGWTPPVGDRQWKYGAVSDWQYSPFAFAAGCYWGDDTSWKIQYIDLSKLAEGVATRDSRFGYLEVPQELKLRDCVRLYIDDDGSLERIYLTSETCYVVGNGKTVEQDYEDRKAAGEIKW
jgi:hypothetical protein